MAIAVNNNNFIYNFNGTNATGSFNFKTNKQKKIIKKQVKQMIKEE